jgi:hypothetical protein
MSSCNAGCPEGGVCRLDRMATPGQQKNCWKLAQFSIFRDAQGTSASVIAGEWPASVALQACDHAVDRIILLISNY